MQSRKEVPLSVLNSPRICPTCFHMFGLSLCWSACSCQTGTRSSARAISFAPERMALAMATTAAKTAAVETTAMAQPGISRSVPGRAA